MAAFIAWLVSLLVWLSADPTSIGTERARCAAAVHCAAACGCPAEVEPAPNPPKPEGCCGECKGTGYLTMPDGHRVKCPCPADCPCRKQQEAQQKPCPDGKCPLPGAKK